jgi:hypothetical protein
LAPVIDTVNTRRAGRVEIEEYAPFANTQSAQPFAVSQSLYVTFTGLAIPRERA